MTEQRLSLELGKHTLELVEYRELTTVEQNLKQHEGGYWAYVSPSARALVRWLADSDTLAGWRLLELGAGLAAPAVAAGVLGAQVVIQDSSAEATAAARRNCELNQVEATVVTCSWSEMPADIGVFDGVLAADVMYEPGMIGPVLRAVRKHLKPGGTLWLADPKRADPIGVLGASRLAGLYGEVVDTVHGATAAGGVNVYRLQRRA